MVQMASKSQIDRLGDRLRQGAYTEDDLRLLDEFRRTFGPAYDHVVDVLQNSLHVPISGRPAKSTTSIVEKLNRESIRLSQLQDIAGCRVVVADIGAQDSIVDAIKTALPSSTIIDRREKPSHGYRAVHVVVHQDGKLIEVQVRTALQHLWAELCEKCADIIDPSLKYGGGPTAVREVLDESSAMIPKIEKLEVAPTMTMSDETVTALRDLRNELIEILQSFTRAVIDSGLGAFS